MTDADTRLASLLAADDAPARDMMFEAVVMTRVEQRRAAALWARWAILAFVALAVLWAAWSSLASVAGDIVMALGVAGQALVAVLAMTGAFWIAWRYMTAAEQEA